MKTISKSELIDELLTDLLELVQAETSNEDGRQGEMYFTRPARDKVEIFIDRVNDQYDAKEISNWLKEEAKDPEEDIRLTIHSDDAISGPVTANLWTGPSHCLQGYGKTPTEAIAKVKAKALAMFSHTTSKGDDSRESRSGDLLRQPRLCPHDA